MLRKAPRRWLTYVAMNIVFGTIGVTAGLCIPLLTDEVSFSQQLKVAMDSGGLYTFVIALVVSTAVSLRQSDSSLALQRTAGIKSTAGLAAFFVVAIASLLSGIQAHVIAIGRPLGTYATTTQIVVFILGTLVALYWFLLSIVEEEYEDYAKVEGDTTRRLADKAMKISDDGSGLRL